MKLTNKKPLLINRHKNFEVVQKIHNYQLHYHDQFITFNTKKELKEFLTEQHNKNLIYDVSDLDLYCVVSKCWFNFPVKSVVRDHFTITY